MVEERSVMKEPLNYLRLSDYPTGPTAGLPKCREDSNKELQLQEPWPQDQNLCLPMNQLQTSIQNQLPLFLK